MAFECTCVNQMKYEFKKTKVCPDFESKYQNTGILITKCCAFNYIKSSKYLSKLYAYHSKDFE